LQKVEPVMTRWHNNSDITNLVKTCYDLHNYKCKKVKIVKDYGGRRWQNGLKIENERFITWRLFFLR
jgi:hypothetical protein